VRYRFIEGVLLKMTASRIKSIVVMVFIMIMLIAATARADLSNITAESYILMDAASGQIIQAQNEHKRLPPASMTKLMTLTLAVEALDKGKVRPNDRVISSVKASQIEGTQIHLKKSEEMSYEHMLIAMALSSANDASIAVAEHLEGSEKNFVAKMNQKARDLGLKDSQFKNATGLPAEGHYSSAYDMAVIARYALTHTRITEYTSLKQYNLRQGSSKLSNSNKLLWWYQGANGLKTGWTSSAKHCLTASAKRGNLQLIAVVMACPRAHGHLQDAIEMLDYGFERYTSKVLLPQGTVCGTVKVKNGEQDRVQVTAAEAVGSVVLKGQEEKLRSEAKLNSIVSAPVKKGQKLGEILVYNNQALLKKVNLLASQDVSAAKLSNIPPHSSSIAYVLLTLFLIIALYLYLKCRSRI